MGVMVSAAKDMILNTFNFKGRLTRAGYWWARFFFIIVNFIILLIEFAADTKFLSNLFTILYFFPILSATVRRFHDVGKSGLQVAVIYIGTFLFAIAATIFFSLFLISLISGSPSGSSLFAAMFFFLMMLGTGIYELVVLCMKSDEDNPYGPKA